MPLHLHPPLIGSPVAQVNPAGFMGVPDPGKETIADIRGVFSRMNFNDSETVALVSASPLPSARPYDQQTLHKAAWQSADSEALPTPRPPAPS